ncbi:hypothetical protein AAVH_10856 [Aphelenchoides avenae]|nr:hypothetical protein AAVH_10856 [Aphelenchus avenae]
MSDTSSSPTPSENAVPATISNSSVPISIQLKLEHVRQIGVAMYERMRITDAVLKKFRRCLDLEAAGTQTDLAKAAAPRADRGIQTDVTAFHEMNAFFWAKIAVTGQHVQDNNQFLKAPMLTASEPPSPSRSPAPSGSALGARAFAEASLAGQQSTAGSDVAHTAVPTPAVAPVTDAAHTAATGPAPRSPTD